MDENRGKQISDRVSAIGKQAEDVGENAATMVGDASRKVRAKTSDIGNQVYEKGADAERSLERMIGDHPVASVLIAAALGYGISHIARRH
jgi:ElaB/YqjD/DUF883 family membrane-anchored ribosome-binding protein